MQTKSGAEAEQRRLLAELAKTGTLTHVTAPSQLEWPVHRFTFNDAVRHFRATRLGTLKPSTRFSYENRLDSLLVPRFGETALADLTDDMLAALDAELAADGLKSIDPAEGTHRVPLGRALGRHGRAARRGTCPASHSSCGPQDGAAIPPGRLGRNSRQGGSAGTAGVRVGCVRRAPAGEVRGLRWSDLDLKGNTLTVRRALTRGEATTPKSGDQRVIPIAAPLRLLLDAAEPRRSSPWAPVAITALGKPWGESGLNQAFKRAQRRAGRSGLCFHDLRHFFVTELFRKGVGAPAVQRLAGHAELSTTQRYADMTANDLRSAIALLGNGEATSEASS